MATIAASAQTGFTKADDYDMFRPTYPQESIDNLLRNLGVYGVNGATIIDLAAGTGKFTSILSARPEKYNIIAIEPHEDMRGVLQEKRLENVTVMNGTADNMASIESGWAQAVIVAQAFHWFANMEALREIHRTLQPTGILGLIWNIEDYNAGLEDEPSTNWEGKLKKIIWSRGDLEPRFRHAKWPEVFDQQLKATPAIIQAAEPLFSLPLGKHVVEWTDWHSKDKLWSRFSTLSHISVLKGYEMEDTRNHAFQAMESEDVQRNEKDEIAFHGRTYSYWTTAIPSEPLGNTQ